MPAHRNVITFGKKQPVYNVTINRHITVKQPKCNCNTSIWSNPMMLMQGFGLFTNFASNMTGMFGTPSGIDKPKEEAPDTTKQFTNLQKLANDFDYEVIQNPDGTFTAYTKDGSGEPITGDFASVRDGILAQSVKPSDNATRLTKETLGSLGQLGDADGLGGTENDVNPTYDKEKDPSNLETINTIKYGGPWHYAQYYTDENGNQLKIGSPEFNEIVNALKTEMGEVEGDRSKRTVPKQLTIGGKTYSLMGSEAREKLGLIGKSGGVDTRYGVIQSGSTYTVYEISADGKTKTAIKSGLTEEAANRLIQEKTDALNGGS